MTYLPAGKGKVAYALHREMGEAIANRLMQTNDENRIYELTGIEMYSYEATIRKKAKKIE